MFFAKFELKDTISNSWIFNVGRFIIYLQQKPSIMIQRIQTLFLLGLVICMSLVLFFPIWEKTNQAGNAKFTLDAFYWVEYSLDTSAGGTWQIANSKTTFYLAATAVLACLVALFSIFQYKARLMQIKLGAINAFILMVYIGLATYFIYQGENRIGFEARGVFKAGYFLPLAALILNSLANRFIKKDENLVRSVDRIR
jgi:hypothetical protein